LVIVVAVALVYALLLRYVAVCYVELFTLLRYVVARCCWLLRCCCCCYLVVVGLLLRYRFTFTLRFTRLLPLHSPLLLLVDIAFRLLRCAPLRFCVVDVVVVTVALRLHLRFGLRCCPFVTRVTFGYGYGLVGLGLPLHARYRLFGRCTGLPDVTFALPGWLLLVGRFGVLPVACPLDSCCLPTFGWLFTRLPLLLYVYTVTVRWLLRGWLLPCHPTRLVIYVAFGCYVWFGWLRYVGYVTFARILVTLPFIWFGLILRCWFDFTVGCCYVCLCCCTFGLLLRLTRLVIYTRVVTHTVYLRWVYLVTLVGLLVVGYVTHLRLRLVAVGLVVVAVDLRWVVCPVYCRCPLPLLLRLFAPPHVGFRCPVTFWVTVAFTLLVILRLVCGYGCVYVTLFTFTVGWLVGCCGLIYVYLRLFGYRCCRFTFVTLRCCVTRCYTRFVLVGYVTLVYHRVVRYSGYGLLPLVTLHYPRLLIVGCWLPVVPGWLVVRTYVYVCCSVWLFYTLPVTLVVFAPVDVCCCYVYWLLVDVIRLWLRLVTFPHITPVRLRTLHGLRCCYVCICLPTR